MIYELHQFDHWAANPDLKEQAAWEQESARVRKALMAMALSHKKESYLRLYFRVHQDGLDGLLRQLKEPRPDKATKQLWQTCQLLDTYIKDHFSRYLSGKAELDSEDPDIDAQKVITTFNVPELGVIIRLFIETGAFRVRNRKALTRFMSRNVGIRSKQVPETFSEEHLYNAIHSPDPQAMDKLQELLNQMLVQLNKLRRDQRKKPK